MCARAATRQACLAELPRGSWDLGFVSQNLKEMLSLPSGQYCVQLSTSFAVDISRQPARTQRNRWVSPNPGYSWLRRQGFFTLSKQDVMICG